jgi:hypothetical protein
MSAGHKKRRPLRRAAANVARYAVVTTTGIPPPVPRPNADRKRSGLRPQVRALLGARGGSSTGRALSRSCSAGRRIRHGGAVAVTWPGRRARSYNLTTAAHDLLTEAELASF